jgi:hypothetical protein
MLLLLYLTSLYLCTMYFPLCGREILFDGNNFRSNKCS